MGLKRKDTKVEVIIHSVMAPETRYSDGFDPDTGIGGPATYEFEWDFTVEARHRGFDGGVVFFDVFARATSEGDEHGTDGWFVECHLLSFVDESGEQLSEVHQPLDLLSQAFAQVEAIVEAEAIEADYE